MGNRNRKATKDEIRQLESLSLSALIPDSETGTIVAARDVRNDALPTPMGSIIVTLKADSIE